jgi:hypothetical protein
LRGLPSIEKSGPKTAFFFHLHVAVFILRFYLKNIEI